MAGDGTKSLLVDGSPISPRRRVPKRLLSAGVVLHAEMFLDGDSALYPEERAA